jgi:Ca2+/Na+ antiporter
VYSLALGIVTTAGQRYGVEDTLKFKAASTFLTVATNLMVTGSILFFLISERLRLSRVFTSKQLGLYTVVVSMLIESALPLAVFGIMYAAAGSKD